jgi:hypothetical protein
MDNKTRKMFQEAAFDLAKQIKKDDRPSPYSYMVLSSFVTIELYFDAVFSVRPEDFPFSTKSLYQSKLKELKTNQIKSLYVFFLLDYFAFLKYEMDPRFFSAFPITYADLETGFNDTFKDYKKELQLLNTVIENFEKPYHPRTFLQRTGLPKQQDDLFLIHTLNELKYELFLQFNKNIARIIKAKK